MKEIRFALNDHFFDFIDDWESKFYMLIGGYGSSKSYHVVVKLLKKALEEKRKILVVRDVFATLRESCFDLFEEVAINMGIEDEMQFIGSPMQIKFYNGSKIIFRGMDNPAKLKSINGVSIIWLEECSEIKYEGFKELLGRLRHFTMSNHFIMSSNPISKSNWVYKYFFKDRNKELTILDDIQLYKDRIIIKNNTYYHHSKVDDNFFVPKSYIEQLDDLEQHDKDLYRIARLGEFGTNGKKVLPQFVAMDHKSVMEAIENIKGPIFKNGMDFGFITSYNSLLRMAIDHKQKILYIYYEYYSRDKTDPEIAEDIKEFAKTKELIIADNAEQKAIKYYKQKGFRIKPCKKFAGSRLAYTKKVKRFNKIICSTNCPNTIEELSDLTYKVDRDGEIIEDKFNIDPHTFSSIWYGLDSYEVSDLKGGSISILK